MNPLALVGSGGSLSSSQSKEQSFANQFGVNFGSYNTGAVSGGQGNTSSGVPVWALAAVAVSMLAIVAVIK